jgi:hypothetical protein
VAHGFSIRHKAGPRWWGFASTPGSRVRLTVLCVASRWEAAPLVAHKKNKDGAVRGVD